MRTSRNKARLIKNFCRCSATARHGQITWISRYATARRFQITFNESVTAREVEDAHVFRVDHDLHVRARKVSKVDSTAVWQIPALATVDLC